MTDSPQPAEPVVPPAPAPPTAPGEKPRYRLPEFAEHLGIEILVAESDRVVGRLVLGPQHSNGHNRVHGGAIMAFADTLGAIGTVLNLRPNTATTTIESKTNFLAAGRGSHLIGDSTPLHIGRNTMVWQTTVRDAEDRRIAVVTQTQLVLTLDPQA
jgi:1,4-dihydroxy-2-naphthoyl-CoA hydrolase